MPKLATKEYCTGCTACASACQSGCIKMTADENGFLFPVIDSQKCVECCLCEKACPILTPSPKAENVPKAYAAYSNDEQIRLESSSGCWVRKDSVKMIEALITASPEFFEGKKPSEVKAFFDRALEFMKSKQAPDTYVSAVVHDLQQALNISDEVIVMERGRVVSAASPDKILSRGVLEQIFHVRLETAGDPAKGYVLNMEKLHQ